MVIIIDNYDSFIYNLYQYIKELGHDVTVFRNDKISCAELAALAPTHLVISPGPCSPKEAGISTEAVKYFAGRIPVLGVCLGHQCIGEAFGGRVVRAPQVMHGQSSPVWHDGKTIYAGISSPFAAGRYHSLGVDRQSLPDDLEVSAWTGKGEIMGLRHKFYTVEGVQFHPESVLTPRGKVLLANFLNIKGGKWHD
ncbi:anthranilate synthase component II [Desulforamulus hydrothermalis]|uniref:Anthranilate synthase component II n=1 Tax=Desulforamulus hydrothermalis Lam5 = DSM 18033 TaxID=1121428 RepID=K8DYY8_9FIRM|nr:aminodeoxychorismate/anthranilate synthase component II [Desulforamulus hydrothermalis]CCO08197.1 Anthranilate synthase component II [Desulforamulus hydrothermalis Lam5 = DSM 18033]SHH22658.1 anthranilate synthase component 2 [Desulforamulus hydrothermalis Lam5 = DSM 18033]